MLRIVTGPFHPVLEHALVEDLRSCKTEDPFAPLAVVVPSVSLVEHLKRVLTRHEPCAFLNIHFLTFHQLALRLREDLVATSQADPEPALQLVDDFFFEQLVRQVVRRRLPGFESFTRLPASLGTWKGLWATVRDLKDASVTPSIALKAVTEGVFEEEDRAWLNSLFTLQAAIMEASHVLGVSSPDDVAASLGRDLSNSPFLKRLQRLFYYGFYDLAQVQLSFFESVVRVRPTTLYFPLQDRQSFFFARQFFERHLLPLADTHEDRGGTKDRPATAERVELSVTSVIGVEDELAAVCREILTLVEVNGYAFDDIGVVARTLEPYQARLQSVFDRHLVPFTSTAGRCLSHEPLVKTLLRLASLPVNDFDRAAMLAVVTSPFYQLQGIGSAWVSLRPDLWRPLVYTLGITKGEAEWGRLAEPGSSSVLREAEMNEDGQAVVEKDGNAQLVYLWTVVSRLIRDCRTLPTKGSINALTEAFLTLVKSHVQVPGLFDEPVTELSEPAGLTKLGLLIRSALARLQQLDPLGGDVTWEEWAELFRCVLEETSIPVEEGCHQGVQVLDAMAARGRTVRALFMLGMNEKQFPRYVREDPFLRDRQRKVLESTLGYKIDQKLSGHEEELLLFELLIRSATSRLYLSYQRADEAGRIMAPSGFIAMATRDPRFGGKPEVTLSRRLTQRIGEQPSIQGLLSADELALGCLLQGHDPGPVLEAMGQDPVLFERGLATLEIIERESPELGEFDGMVGAPASTFPIRTDESFSPTALERYATCPFQYFAGKLLRLEPVQRIRHDHLPALLRGTLAHASLRKCYEQLALLRWPDDHLTEATIQSTVSQAVTATFAAHAASQGTGHALLWTMAQEEVTELVAAAVCSDQAEYRSTGFRPIAFEAAAEGVVPLQSEGASRSLKVHGILDRVDYRADPPSLRIVDYKFKQGNEIAAEDRNLAMSAVRGFRLQPPLYACMTLPSFPVVTDVQLLFLAPKWKQTVSRSTFDAGLWTSQTGDMIRQTLSVLIQGIGNREFFILPDGYCDYCEFSSACRRHDTTVWLRSYRSTQARALRRLRKRRLSDE
jgi:ATP-dependent helicase/nuclease subunit B